VNKYIKKIEPLFILYMINVLFEWNITIDINIILIYGTKSTS